MFLLYFSFTIKQYVQINYRKKIIYTPIQIYKLRQYREPFIYFLNEDNELFGFDLLPACSYFSVQISDTYKCEPNIYVHI